MYYKILITIVGLILALGACGNKSTHFKLPILGNKTPVENNGKTDTIYHQIGNFSFINQNGDSVNNKTVAGKIYVADFFFTSCPTICPKVKRQMKRVYAEYENNPAFLMISHSIDTKFDTVGRLNWYAQKMNAKAPSWNFVTGEKTALYKIAYDYLLTALEGNEFEGGFDHSGAMALVDKKGHIRGLYDGLDEAKVNLLIQDIAILLKEKD